jgi:hypothetical protein
MIEVKDSELKRWFNKRLSRYGSIGSIQPHLDNTPYQLVAARLFSTP